MVKWLVDYYRVFLFRLHPRKFGHLVLLHTYMAIDGTSHRWNDDWQSLFPGISIDCKMWLAENCEGEYEFIPKQYAVRFSHKTDAALFRLMWE